MFTKSQVYNYEINDHFSCKRIIFSTVSQNMTETCNDFRIYRLLRSHFLKKKTWKNAIFRIYRPLPYSSRDGENMLSSCPPSTPSVKITPKILAKIASLNSSIAFGDLRLGGCLRGPPSQAPARAQSPTRNTRIKRRNFRTDFVGYFDVPESEVYTPEFLVRAPLILGVLINPLNPNF